MWGVLGLLGGGEKGQGSDVVMEFLSDAPAPRRHPRSPATSNQIETPRGLRLLYVHESRRRKLAPPLADSKDEIWDPKSPPSAIPKVGVSH